MPVRSFSEAEMILSHRRRVEVPLLVTVWLGAAAFGLAEGSAFYFLATTLAVGANLLAVTRNREVYVRRTLVNVGVLAATAIIALELAGGNVWLGGRNLWLLVALGHYLILIQLCKLFEQKRHRDYVQLLVMSLLLVIAGAVISSGLWFAAVLVAYLAIAAYSTMAFTLKRGLDAAAAARLASEKHPMQPRVVAWSVIRHWPRKDLLRRLSILLAAILATGVAMFLLAPRAVWEGQPTTAIGRGGRTGFRNYLRLGETSRIYLSNEVLMTVTVSPEPQGPPAPAPLYLRGKTFDVYANSTWSSSTRRIAAGGPAAGECFRQDVTYDRSLLPTVFAAYPAVRGESPDGAVRFDGHLNATLSCQYQPGRSVSYTAWSWAGPLTPQQRQFLQGCGDVPQREPAEACMTTEPVKRLAADWCGDILAKREPLPPGIDRDELDLQIAHRIADKLRSEYGYTLDLSASNPDRDAVEDFLLYMRQGHCEYFASALAVMCRSLDVHARVAAGFRADGPVEPDTSIPVRAKDAHAWCEVFTPSTHWVTIDATPGGRTAQTRGWWRRLGDTLHTWRFFWNQKVVGYDEVARRGLFRWFGGLFAAVKDAIVHAFRTLARSFVNLMLHGRIDKALVYFSLSLSGLGILLLALLIARTLRREMPYRKLLRAGEVVPWPQLKFFRRLLSLLERRGLELRRDRTPREHVAAAVERFNLPAAMMKELVDLYYDLRWGRRPAAAETILAAEGRVAGIAKMLKK